MGIAPHRPKATFGPEQQLYQPLTTEEDHTRTNLHYEQPPEFFQRITGGEWNVYSCNLWDRARTDTESQEAKLDLLAELMELRSGQRILDIGCGWAGPLTYLCKTYGVRGGAQRGPTGQGGGARGAGRGDRSSHPERPRRGARAGGLGAGAGGLAAVRAR